MQKIKKNKCSSSESDGEYSKDKANGASARMGLSCRCSLLPNAKAASRKLTSRRVANTNKRGARWSCWSFDAASEPTGLERERRGE